MTEMHLAGMILLKLWWFIAPLVILTIYGIRSDRKEVD